MKRPFLTTARPVLALGLTVALHHCFTAETQAQKSSLTKIPVTVTVLESPDGNLFSDGKGAYFHGVDKVQAFILNNPRNAGDPINGLLDVITGQATSSDKRRMIVALDASDVIEGTSCDSGNVVPELPHLDCDGKTGFDPRWCRFATMPAPGLPRLNLLNMLPGAIDWTGFGLKFFDTCNSALDNPWVVAFQNDGQDWDDYACLEACGARVRVEAWSAVPGKGVSSLNEVDRWIITADLNDPGAALACLWSGVTDMTGPAIHRERVRVQFKIQVDLK